MFKLPAAEAINRELVGQLSQLTNLRNLELYHENVSCLLACNSILKQHIYPNNEDHTGIGNVSTRALNFMIWRLA